MVWTQWNIPVTHRSSGARLSLHIAPGFLQKSISGYRLSLFSAAALAPSQ
jgi:hypothetical protein